MFNKRRFNKVNDKKILHKVKKQWVTISLSLLMMIGGGAVATHVSADADTNVNTKPQVASNAPQSNNTSNITNQAKSLHNNMLRNANLTQAKPASLGATNTQTPKIVKIAKWNNVNVNYYNNDVMELTGNGSINASDVPNLPVNSNNSDWNLKVDKSNAHIVLNNSKNGGQFSARFHPIWNHFKNMDLSGLDTSNVTNMSNMFENDSHLQSLNLSNFNTNNVTNMNYMFSGVYSLNSLDLSSFNTNHATMTDFMDIVPNILTLGNNSHLIPGAVPVTKLNSSDFTNNYDMYGATEGPDYSSDGMYPNNSDANLSYPYINLGLNPYILRYNGEQNASDGDIFLLMDNKGNVVDKQLSNGTIPSGTYYKAYPTHLVFTTQYNDVIPTPYFIYTPYTPNYNVLSKSTNGKNERTNEVTYPGFDYIPSISSQIRLDTGVRDFFNNDYSINKNGQNYMPMVNYYNNTGSDFMTDNYINVNITANYPKIISDASHNIKNWLNYVKTYSLPDTQSNINDLKDYVQQANHDLSEPTDVNTVIDIINQEHEANKDYGTVFEEVIANLVTNEAKINDYISKFNAMVNNVSLAPNTVSEKDNDKAILNQAYRDTNYDIGHPSKANLDNSNYETELAYNTYTYAYELVADARENSYDERFPEVFTPAVRSQDAKRISNTKSIIDKQYNYTNSVANNPIVKADPNIKGLNMAQNMISSADQDITYGMNHVTPVASINALYDFSYAAKYYSAPYDLQQAIQYVKAHHMNIPASASSASTSSTVSQSVAPASSQASSNASQSVSPNSKASTNSSQTNSATPSSKASAKSSQAKSSASQSVSPSSKASTNSSKASSSVVPSSTSSKTSTTSNKASNSSAQSSSTNSQSSHSTASQSNNGSSNVAPSSEQQSSNNNNPTPFVPSFNIPSVPSTPVAPTDNTTSVTPASTEDTTPMDNSNNSINSSVASSVEPENMNNGNNDNVTAPTVTSHKNHKNAVHHAKRVSLYLFNSDFKGLSKRNHSVITIKGVEAYRRTRKGHYVVVRGIKRGTKLAVKRVIKFGKITKLQLTNGWIVTSNKHFVAIRKPAKRVNKRITKRNRVSRYTRALRKSNYVLHHGRRHATRYIYRTAKKFNKANNAEKRAYRKFARKHTNRNRKVYRKAQVNVNNLVNALLK